MYAAVVFAIAALTLQWADAGRGIRRYALRWWLVLLLLLVIWSGNRFNGADWINYKRTFDLLATINSVFSAIVESPFEWLFSTLLWSIGQLGLSYETVVIAIGAFNTLCLLHITRRFGALRPGWTLALVFLIEGWTLYHEQLRQSVAVNLCVLALLAMRRRHQFTGLALWVCALGFHSSAIVAPMLLLIARRVELLKNRPISIRAIVVIAGATFASIGILMEIVRVRTPLISGIERLQSKLDLYEQHDIFGGSLFTPGLVAYAIGFLLLWRIRHEVLRRENFWLSFAWTTAMVWSVLGPLLRTQAILIRFEHYFLFFVPFALGLVASRERMAPSRSFWLTLLIVIFATTFPLRVFLNPENLVWSHNYQNSFLYGVFGIDTQNVNLRERAICLNLALFGNDFCD